MKANLCAIAFTLAFAAGCDTSGHVEWNNGQPASEAHEQGIHDGSTPADLRKQARVIIQTRASAFEAGKVCQVDGSFESLPRGWQMYAFLESSPYGLFFPQTPRVRVNEECRTFSHPNIRADDDIHALHIALANTEAAEWLDRRAALCDWSGIAVLPEGIVVCDTVEIH